MPLTIAVASLSKHLPPVMAKSEAFALLQTLPNAESLADHELVLNFHRVMSVTPSAARAVLTGLVRRYGVDFISRVVFSNVAPHLVGVLEDAFEDLSGDRQRR